MSVYFDLQYDQFIIDSRNILDLLFTDVLIWVGHASWHALWPSSSCSTAPRHSHPTCKKYWPSLPPSWFNDTPKLYLFLYLKSVLQTWWIIVWFSLKVLIYLAFSSNSLSQLRQQKDTNDMRRKTLFKCGYLDTCIFFLSIESVF